MKQVIKHKQQQEPSFSMFYTFKQATSSSAHGSIRVTILHLKERIRFIIPGLSHLPSAVWSHKTLNTSHPEYKRIIKTLMRFEEECHKIFRDLTSQIIFSEDYYRTLDFIRYDPKRSLQIVKNRITNNNPDAFSSEKYLHEYFGEFIHWHVQTTHIQDRVLKESTIRQYNTTCNNIKEFEKRVGRICLNDFSIEHSTEMLGIFKTWLKVEKKYKETSLKKLLKQMNTFLSYVQMKRIITDNLVKFKCTDQVLQKAGLYLHEHEIRALHDFEGLSGVYEKVRRIFLIAIWTGLRYSDFFQIPAFFSNEHDVINEHDDDIVRVVNIRTVKGNRLVPIPIMKQIIPHLEYLKEHGLTALVTNQNNNGKFNKKLREIFEMAELDRKVMINDDYYPLHELATSHLGRVTFINILKRDAVDETDIQVMTGHQSMSVFRGYLRPSNDDIKVSVTGSVREHWNSTVPIAELSPQEFLEQRKLLNSSFFTSPGSNSIG
jgi:site-specific recombinase XerD